MREFAKHLEVTLRSFARQPGMALIVVLTLALGIGASTALFAYLAAILWPQMDAPSPERVVWIDTGTAEEPRAGSSISSISTSSGSRPPCATSSASPSSGPGSGVARIDVRLGSAGERHLLLVLWRAAGAWPAAGGGRRPAGRRARRGGQSRLLAGEPGRGPRRGRPAATDQCADLHPGRHRPPGVRGLRPRFAALYPIGEQRPADGGVAAGEARDADDEPAGPPRPGVTPRQAREALDRTARALDAAAPLRMASAASPLPPPPCSTRRRAPIFPISPPPGC